MFKYIALSLAAFLPVFSYQLSKFNYPLNEPIRITVSVFIGMIWWIAESNVYFSSIIIAGSYAMLRLK